MEEITLASYFEHLKYAKELALFLPLRHPKRIKVDKAINEMIVKLNL